MRRILRTKRNYRKKINFPGSLDHINRIDDYDVLLLNPLDPGWGSDSTTQEKYGNSSLYLSGESDHLLIDYQNDLNLDDRDFTIEWWEYRLAP